MNRIALALAVVMTATPAGALTLIDDFTTGAYNAFLDVNTTVSDVQTGSMVGGERHTTFQVDTTAGGFAYLRIDGVSGSRLSLDSGIDVLHALTLSYGDPTTNPLGLDLSAENRFALRFYFSDLPLEVTARVYTSENAWAEGSGTLAPSMVYPIQDLFFSTFVTGGSDPGSFSLANVNKIEITTRPGSPTGANDFRVLELVAVPEADTFALMTAGLAGLVVAGRRRVWREGPVLLSKQPKRDVERVSLAAASVRI